MEITEVRVKLIQNPSDRLKAFCSVTFDSDFVIRDIKVIEGTSGIFVAMPSRKLSDHCPQCHSKNHLRAQYCNECGAGLGKERVRCDDAGRRKLHADIAHPINTECRQRLQEFVVEAFEKETDAAKNPDYKPTDYDDEYNEETEKVEAVEEVDEDVVEEVDEEVVEEVVEEVDEDEQVDVVDTSDDDDGAADPDAYGQMILELKRDAADRRTGTHRPQGHTPRVAPAAHRVNNDTKARPNETFAKPVARVQPTPPTPEPAPQPSFSDDDAFGAGLDVERVTRKPAAIRTEPKREPKPEPQRAPEPATIENDDGDDFGAGLL